MSAVPIPKASSKSAKIAEAKIENLSPSEITRRDKILEQAKYTDVKRTSSASFKPPMSKDSIPKSPIQPPPKDSSWFAPFSYIKSVFGSKPVATTSSTTKDKSHKSERVNNLNHSGKPNKDSGKYSKYISDSDMKTNDRIHSLGTEGKESSMSTLQTSNNEVIPSRPKSPSFSISPKDAITKREVHRNYSSGPIFNHDDDDVDPMVPKYNQIQSVDNQSTYLHAPDKKGTTSFRITTAPKVGLKQLPTLLSPSFSSQAQQKRPVKMSRKGSTSPHKTRTDIGSARLRSKSTPDSSSIKTRPVSVAAIPKSLNLKPTSQKIVPSNSENKEIGPVVTNAKTLPKASFSYNANKLRENISLSHPRNKLKLQKSPITINHTSTNAFAATKTQTHEDHGYDSVQNVSCSNSTLRGKPEPVSSPKLTTYKSMIPKRSTANVDSPTFLVPSMPRTQRNGKSIIERYQDSMQMRKSKMKSKSQLSLSSALAKPQDPFFIMSTVQKQTMGRIRSPRIAPSPLGRHSSDSIIETNPSMAKTVTLCQDMSKDEDTDISFPASESSLISSHEEFKAIQLNNQMKAQNNEDDNRVESGDGTYSHNQKPPCIRMVNSSQYHPKHPSKPQVIDLNNRKTSSFTDLLVADRKDSQSESDVSGELTNDSYNKCNQTPKSSEIQNHLNSISTRLCHEDGEELMSSAPRFYDTCNSASCEFHTARGKVNNTFNDYEIDSLICDDMLVYQNTCNSANREEVVNYNRKMNDTFMDDDLFNEQSHSRSNSRRKSLPRRIYIDSIDTFDDQTISECNLSTWETLSPIERRKYPFDLQHEKIQELESNKIRRLPSPNRKPAKELSSKNKKKTPNILYLQASKRPNSPRSKGSSTLQFLQQNARVDTPTILEPSQIEKPKFFSSPSSYTPSNNFNSIASSVGEAIGAITSAFQSSFMNMVSPTAKKSPNVSHVRHNSPSKPEVKQISSSHSTNTRHRVSNMSPRKDHGPTRVVEKPLSATRSYVSSVLEENGLSKSVENGLSTLKYLIDGRDKKATDNVEKRSIMKEHNRSPEYKNGIQKMKDTADPKNVPEMKSNLEPLRVKSMNDTKTVEKMYVKSNENLYNQDMKQAYDKKKRAETTEKENKRNTSPYSFTQSDKHLGALINTAPNKSNRSETKIQKTESPTTTPLEGLKPDKNDTTEKLKAVTPNEVEKTVSVTKIDPKEINKAKADASKTAEGGLSGKGLFSPLIVVKIPNATGGKKEVKKIKHRKNDPDVFACNKSHFGEL